MNTPKPPKRVPTFTTARDGAPIVRVPLATGQTATLDRADWDSLRDRGVSPHWTFNPASRDGLCYVRVRDAAVVGNLRIVSRLIMDAKTGEAIRYRDDCRLNLRRANLIRQGAAAKPRHPSTQLFAA